jgi:hypothetical protein
MRARGVAIPSLLDLWDDSTAPQSQPRITAVRTYRVQRDCRLFYSGS